MMSKNVLIIKLLALRNKKGLTLCVHTVNHWYEWNNYSKKQQKTFKCVIYSCSKQFFHNELVYSCFLCLHTNFWIFITNIMTKMNRICADIVYILGVARLNIYYYICYYLFYTYKTMFRCKLCARHAVTEQKERL